METSTKTFLITGGNSGLGYQCALEIAKREKDACIVLACRDREKARKAVKDLNEETGNATIHSMELDLASLASIRSFPEAFAHMAFPPLSGLVCNAGIGPARKLSYTQDGFELTFGVNHLGHF